MTLLLAVLGLMAGSAANAVIDRLPRGESWFTGRSHCDKCKHVLGFWDLVPVFSYVGLGGRCRYCRSPIPARNILIEVFLGVSFAIIFNFQFTTRLPDGQVYNVLILSAILWTTTVIAVMDWETKLVSEALVVAWAAMIALGRLSDLGNLSYLIGVVVGVGLIGGIWAVSRGKAMGFGDVEIAAVLGWWLGWPGIAVGMWLAFVLGGVVGSYRLAIGKAKLKSEIAFGPFLILGGWISYIWGEKIWSLIF